MNEILRVVIADEQTLTRVSIRRVLERTAGVTVCAEAFDAAGAVDAAIEHRPDVCLLDVGIPGGGIAAVWEITARLPTTAVVVLSDSDADVDLFAALRAGASGYLLKPLDRRRLPHALWGVARGEAALSRMLTARVIAQFRDTAPPWRSPVDGRSAHRLTSREWQILKLTQEGLTTNQIARRLCLAPATVRSHRAHISRKLQGSESEEVHGEDVVEPKPEWRAGVT